MMENNTTAPADTAPGADLAWMDGYTPDALAGYAAGALAMNREDARLSVHYLRKIGFLGADASKTATPEDAAKILIALLFAPRPIDGFRAVALFGALPFACLAAAFPDTGAVGRCPDDEIAKHNDPLDCALKGTLLSALTGLIAAYRDKFEEVAPITIHVISGQRSFGSPRAEITFTRAGTDSVGFFGYFAGGPDAPTTPIIGHAITITAFGGIIEMLGRFLAEARKIGGTV